MKIKTWKRNICGLGRFRSGIGQSVGELAGMVTPLGRLMISWCLASRIFAERDNDDITRNDLCIVSVPVRTMCID